MTASRDPDSLIHAFLREGDDELHDQVYDAVRAAIDQKRQRAVLGPWRARLMNRIVTLGLAAAAVIIAVVVGAQLIGPPSNEIGGPTNEPIPTLEPTATPEPTATTEPADARFPAWYPPADVADANGAGILSAGNHATRTFQPGFTFTAPEGWVNTYDEPDYFTLFPDTPANQAEFARSEELANHLFMGPHSSPWFSCESAEDNSGATAAEIVAAASATEALAVSDPVDVMIGGLTGIQFDVRRNPDWTGSCPGDSGLPEGIDPDEERTRAILLDLPSGGVLVIFMYSTSPVEHDGFIAEVMPIVESFEFNQ